MSDVTGAAGPAQAAPAALSFRRSRNLKEQAIGAVLFASAAASTLVTLGIVVVLLRETLVFFSQVSPAEFFLGTQWTPLFQNPRFGVLPLMAGSFIVAAGAAVLAVPVGLLSAIYLSEYAGQRLRGVLKPVLEILAGIPTVVYGYFALTFITPLLRTVFPAT
ncbi:MAG: phosphate ABC transporter permease subunit PstC, partial [Deltaproteobacteria bacterium]|nr:phosphate ABC transporter permease subunit PstC [Deltaproteobacteria bacterium]